MEQEIQLNSHNKQEFPPMHSAEHLLNGTMVKMIGCKRSRNAHIERKKSKCDYPLPEPLTQEQLQEIEDMINSVIEQNMPSFMSLSPPARLPLSMTWSDCPMMHQKCYASCTLATMTLAHAWVLMLKTQARLAVFAFQVHAIKTECNASSFALICRHSVAYYLFAIKHKRMPHVGTSF